MLIFIFTTLYSLDCNPIKPVDGFSVWETLRADSQEYSQQYHTEPSSSSSSYHPLIRRSQNNNIINSNRSHKKSGSSYLIGIENSCSDIDTDHDKRGPLWHCSSDNDIKRMNERMYRTIITSQLERE